MMNYYTIYHMAKHFEKHYKEVTNEYESLLQEIEDLKKELDEIQYNTVVFKELRYEFDDEHFIQIGYEVYQGKATKKYFAAQVELYDKHEADWIFESEEQLLQWWESQIAIYQIIIDENIDRLGEQLWKETNYLQFIQKAIHTKKLY